MFMIDDTCNASYSDFSSCSMNWLHKRTTEFYRMDDHIILPWWFGALCWSYTLGGIAMLLSIPHWTKKCFYPYRTFAMVLIFIQGPLSFQADFMNLTNDSIYHVLDRSFACINLFFECGKMLCVYNNVGFEIFCCYFANLSFGLFCFMNSQDAQMNSSPDLFIFWHTLWHVYPLIYTVIRIVELHFTKINVQADDFQILSSSDVKVPLLNFRWAIKSQKLKYRDL